MSESDGLMMKYFVLSPKSSDPAHRKASRNALLAYAVSVNETTPTLAQELYDWVSELEDQDAFSQQ